MTERTRRELIILLTVGATAVLLPVVAFSVSLLSSWNLATFWYGRKALNPDVPVHAAPSPVVEASHDRPFAVMIDNHPDALPQSGLSKADIVWDALVEGGLTRYMAIFRSRQADEIGPVRSARPYFIQWAGEFGAVYAHFGGSDEALHVLASGKSGVNDADGMKDGVTFWRDDARAAPHNAYTSSEKIRALIARRDWTSTAEGILAGNRSESATSGAPAADITVRYGNGTTTSEFRYDPVTRSYARYIWGERVADRDGTPVAPRTVAVLATDLMKIDDPHAKGLIGLRTTGSGEAWIFRDGEALEGSWKKASADGKTRIALSDGTAATFAPGQVWISVVARNRDGGVSYK